MAWVQRNLRQPNPSSASHRSPLWRARRRSQASALHHGPLRTESQCEGQRPGPQSYGQQRKCCYRYNHADGERSAVNGQRRRSKDRLAKPLCKRRVNRSRLRYGDPGPIGGFDDGFDAAWNGSPAIRRGRELSRLGALCDKRVRRWVVQWLEHDRQSADP